MPIKYDAKNADKWFDLDSMDSVGEFDDNKTNNLVLVFETNPCLHTFMRMVLRKMNSTIIEVIHYSDGNIAFHTSIPWSEWNKFCDDKNSKKVSRGYGVFDVDLSDSEDEDEDPSSDEPTN